MVFKLPLSVISTKDWYEDRLGKNGVINDLCHKEEVFNHKKINQISPSKVTVLESVDLLRYFKTPHMITTSAQLGKEKPSREIFDEAIRKAQVSMLIYFFPFYHIITLHIIIESHGNDKVMDI